jgi:hypothetical protein
VEKLNKQKKFLKHHGLKHEMIELIYMLYFLPVFKKRRNFFFSYYLFFFDIDSNNLDALINAIKLTRDLSGVNQKQLFTSAIR